MTLPTNAPGGGQRPAQGSRRDQRRPPARTAEQIVTAPVPPDQIDFSRLVEEQFQIALAEDEEERAQQRRLHLYIIIGIAAAVLILAFAVVATIFGWWPVVLDIVLVLVVLLNGVLLDVPYTRRHQLHAHDPRDARRDHAGDPVAARYHDDRARDGEDRQLVCGEPSGAHGEPGSRRGGRRRDRHWPREDA